MPRLATSLDLAILRDVGQRVDASLSGWGKLDLYAKKGTAPENISVTGWLMEPPRVIDNGGAQHVLIERPGRPPIKHYTGEGLAQIEIPLLLDRRLDIGTDYRDHSVEELCRALRQLKRRHAGHVRPPIVLMRGPVELTELEWVIDDIEWGATERNPSYSTRIRQFVTVTLGQYVSETFLQTSIEAARARGGSLPQPGIVVAAGQTSLTEVLRAQGIRPDPDVLQAWRKANNLKSVRSKLRTGQRLRRP